MARGRVVEGRPRFSSGLAALIFPLPPSIPSSQFLKALPLEKGVWLVWCPPTRALSTVVTSAEKLAKKH